MKNTCYLCGMKSNESFPDEHIFPRALNGILKTSNICKKCNNQIGTMIDSKVIEDPLIKLARYKLNISAPGRRVKHPLEGYGIDEETQKKVVTKFENGALKSYYLPEYQEEINGNHIQMKGFGSLDRADEIVRGLMKKGKKRNLVLTDINIEMNPPSQIRINKQIPYMLKDYLPFLLKVAYELLIHHAYIKRYSKISDLVYQYLFNNGLPPFNAVLRYNLDNGGSKLNIYPHLLYLFKRADKSVYISLYNVIVGRVGLRNYDIKDYLYYHDVVTGKVEIRD
jgi:hypothetical protein